MKIYWSTFSLKHFEYYNRERDAALMFFSEPLPVFKHIVLNDSGASIPESHLACPSFVDYCKNTFVITAPFDMELTIDRNNQVLNTSFSQNLYDAFVENRGFMQSSHFTVTLPPSYIFYSDETVVMESMPCFLQHGQHLDGLHLVPGTFDISKWIRPVDFTIQISEHKNKISLKKGDPLFYVRFRTPNNEKVELERVEYTEELDKLCRTFVGVKDVERRLPLKKLYEMAEPFIRIFKKKNIKKCPFGFTKGK